MKKITLVVIAVIIVAALILAGCASPSPSTTPSPTPAPKPAPAAEKEIVIKVAHPHSTNTYMHQEWEVLKEEWEKVTNGRVKVELFPAGQLYKNEVECIAAVSSGAIQLTQAPTFALATYDPQWKAFDLPFMFESLEVYSAINSL